MNENYKAALKQSRKDTDVEFQALDDVYGVVCRNTRSALVVILLRILNSDTPATEVEAVKSEMYKEALRDEMAEKGYKLEEPTPSLHEGRTKNLAGKTRRTNNPIYINADDYRGETCITINPNNGEASDE
jgi:hypothetical protein